MSGHTLKDKILQISYKDSAHTSIDRKEGIKGIIRKLKDRPLPTEDGGLEVASLEDTDEVEKSPLKGI
jgi:hypothetical protein